MARLLVLVCAWTLGVVFLYAAYPKIHDPRDFARIVYHYRLLGPSHSVPPLLANVFSVTLPWVEGLVGLLLVIGAWRREAALVASVLLVMFLLGVGAALAQGVDVENCGCFSVSGKGRKAGLGLLAGDSALLAAAAFVASRKKPAAAIPR